MPSEDLPPSIIAFSSGKKVIKYLHICEDCKEPRYTQASTKIKWCITCARKNKNVNRAFTKGKP